jgi:tRNA(fMet)-specific endonuclease VapC
VIRYLLDTDACIDLIRGRDPEILSRLERQPVGSVAISAVTWAELRFGVERSDDPPRNLAALVLFCAPLPVLPFDTAAGGVYGRARAALCRSGTPIGPLDLLIAAHALSAGLTLVTGNVREFRRVEGLRVEDWRRR